MAEKLTDKEIIKALECCTPENESCLNCPLIDVSVPECAGILYKATIDLINSQQAEIERLSNSAKQWEDTAKNLLISKEKQQAEIEDLNKNRNGLLRKCVSAYHEGINCFAERLCDGRVSNDPVVIAVKAELKEMVGEQE